MLHSPPLFRPLKHTAKGKRHAWLSPLRETLQTVILIKRSQEFHVARDMCVSRCRPSGSSALPGAAAFFVSLPPVYHNTTPKSTGGRGPAAKTGGTGCAAVSTAAWGPNSPVGHCSSAIERRTSVGSFPRWFFLLIYRGLLAPFVRLRWRCCPTWPSALADPLWLRALARPAQRNRRSGCRGGG